MKPTNLQELLVLKGPDWEKYILHSREVLSDKLLSDAALIRLSINTDEPEELTTIIKCLYQDSKERPTGIAGIDYFFKVVNYSNYSLRKWLKVVHYFNKWLEKENRQSSFLKQLGYLQCCEESPENKDIDLPFLDLVEDMLTTHGFVG